MRSCKRSEIIGQKRVQRGKQKKTVKVTRFLRVSCTLLLVGTIDEKESKGKLVLICPLHRKKLLTHRCSNGRSGVNAAKRSEDCSTVQNFRTISCPTHNMLRFSPCFFHTRNCDVSAIVAHNTSKEPCSENWWKAKAPGTLKRSTISTAVHEGYRMVISFGNDTCAAMQKRTPAVRGRSVVLDSRICSLKTRTLMVQTYTARCVLQLQFFLLSEVNAQ